MFEKLYNYIERFEKEFIDTYKFYEAFVFVEKLLELTLIILLEKLNEKINTKKQYRK